MIDAPSTRAGRLLRRRQISWLDVLVLAAAVLLWVLLRPWSEPPPDLDFATYDHSVNNHGRLFLLQREGYGDIYVFGTFHSNDPRVLDLPASVEAALARADVLASESLHIQIKSHYYDPVTGEGAVYDLPEEDFKHLCLSEDSLRETLGDALFARLYAAVSAPPLNEMVGPLTADQLDHVTSACISFLLQTPVSEFQRSRSGVRVLDNDLLFRAGRQQKQVVRLESFEEQTAFLLSKPRALVIEETETNVSGDRSRLEEIWERWIKAYLHGDIDNRTWFGEMMPQSAEYWLEAGIVARNHRMVETILDLADERTIFVASGAGHLSGEEGIVNLLAREGYSVTVLEPPP